MKLVKTFTIVFAFFIIILSCKTTEAGVDTKTKVRYIEIYGSICCPRDYKHDNSLRQYIKNFENKNNVVLKANFILPLGREGEAGFFLSLEKLSRNLQKKFVNERLNQLKTNDKSAVNHLKKPIYIKQALTMWDNSSINNLIKF